MQANVTRCLYLLFGNIMSNEGWMRQRSRSRSRSRSRDIPHISWYIDIYRCTRTCSFLIKYVINLLIFVRVVLQKTGLWNVPLRQQKSAIEKDTILLSRSCVKLHGFIKYSCFQFNSLRPSDAHVGRWTHDDVIKWKHFPCYWHYVRGVYRSPVNSPHKGQWRGALIFSLISV